MLLIRLIFYLLLKRPGGVRNASPLRRESCCNRERSM